MASDRGRTDSKGPEIGIASSAIDGTADSFDFFSHVEPLDNHRAMSRFAFAARFPDETDCACGLFKGRRPNSFICPKCPRYGERISAALGFGVNVRDFCFAGAAPVMQHDCTVSSKALITINAGGFFLSRP
jgi:hypothetical protein